MSWCPGKCVVPELHTLSWKGFFELLPQGNFSLASYSLIKNFAFWNPVYLVVFVNLIEVYGYFLKLHNAFVYHDVFSFAYIHYNKNFHWQTSIDSKVL